MTTLPEVLVGGYPNSGTSFLTNLIALLGKSPGSAESLKGADEHNRWGYFEHLKIRQLTWKAAGWDKFKPDIEGFLPDKPLTFSRWKMKTYTKKITRIANTDGVELYKDNALPVLYNLFPKTSKFLIVKRNIQNIHTSPQKAGFEGYTRNLHELKHTQDKYQHLAQIMSKDVDCLFLNYEDFEDDFSVPLTRIGTFLGIKLTPDLHIKCRNIFRPRKSVN